jgi:hypothetical protein
MIRMEVKHDSMHKTWHRLSVGFHDGLNKPASLHLLESAGWAHVLQYAIDHQMDPNMIAFRTIDNNGAVIFTKASHATSWQNKE